MNSVLGQLEPSWAGGSPGLQALIASLHNGSLRGFLGVNHRNLVLQVAQSPQYQVFHRLLAPSIATAAALGGVPSKSAPGKAVQDVILKASPGSTLLGPAAYELHLQIVSPDPEEIAADLITEV